MKFRGVGGRDLGEIPSVVAYEYFLELHILDTLRNKDHLSKVTVNQKTEKNEETELL